MDEKNGVCTLPTLQSGQLSVRPLTQQQYTSPRSVFRERELAMLSAIIDGLGRRPNKYERVAIEELKRFGLPTLEIFEQSSEIDQEIYSLLADAIQASEPDLASYEKAGRLICQQASKQALEYHVGKHFGRDLNTYELVAIEHVPFLDEEFLNDKSETGARIYALLQQATDIQHLDHPDFSKFEQAGRLIFEQISIQPPNYKPPNQSPEQGLEQSQEQGPKKSTKRRVRKRCQNCSRGHRTCDLKRPSCSLCLRKDQNCVYPVYHEEESIPASSNQGSHSMSPVHTPQAQQAPSHQPSPAGSFDSITVSGSPTDFGTMNALNSTTGFGSSSESCRVTHNSTHSTRNLAEETTSQGFATSSSIGTSELRSAPNSVASVRQLKRIRDDDEVCMRGGGGKQKDADSSVNSLRTPQHTRKRDSKRGSLNNNGSERRRRNSIKADPDETESDADYQERRGRASRAPPQKGPKAPARRSMRPRISTGTTQLPTPSVQGSPSTNASPEKNDNQQQRGRQTRRAKQKGTTGYEEVLVPEHPTLYTLSQSHQMPEVLKAPTELGPMQWVQHGASFMQVPVFQPSNDIELYGAQWPQYVSRAQVANEEVQEDRINWDYETGAVMAGIENWNPQPIVHPTLDEDTQRQYKKKRLHECLREASNDFKDNIFEVDAKKWREDQRERLGGVKFQKYYSQEIERETLERLTDNSKAKEKVVEAEDIKGLFAHTDREVLEFNNGFPRMERDMTGKETEIRK